MYQQQLQNYINRYIFFEKEETADFFQNFQVKEYNKKDFLLKEGDTCQHLFFIISGLVRCFYTTEKGYEHITQFALENWWLTNHESFLKEKASSTNIQALEKTTVLAINKKDLNNAFDQHPKLERLFRILSENMIMALQRKSDIYWQRNSKGRYESFSSKHPDFIQRVPQYMIASYLEITPEYLSEIRKQIK